MYALSLCRVCLKSAHITGVVHSPQHQSIVCFLINSHRIIVVGVVGVSCEGGANPPQPTEPYEVPVVGWSVGVGAELCDFIHGWLPCAALADAILLMRA